jgi:hypothetical protein
MYAFQNDGVPAGMDALDRDGDTELPRPPRDRCPDERTETEDDGAPRGDDRHEKHYPLRPRHATATLARDAAAVRKAGENGRDIYDAPARS